MSSPGRTSQANEEDWRERFSRTLRVLEHEVRSGCKDTVVYGGLERLVTAFRDDLESTLPAVVARVPAAVAGYLHDYRELDPNDRAERAQQAIALLRRGLAGRVDTVIAGRSVPETRPTSPARPTTQPSPTQPIQMPAAPTAVTLPPPAGSPRSGIARSPLPPPGSPIAEVRGIGATRAKLYAKLGIETVGDLLNHFPTRHVAFPPPLPAVDLLFTQTASYVGRLTKVEVSRNPRGLNRTTATLADDSGSVQAVWFRAGYGALNARPGDLVAISGPLTTFSNRVVFESPEWELAEQTPTHTRRLVPIYPLTAGLNLRTLRDQIRRAVDQYAASLPDMLSERLRYEERLPPLSEAVAQIHFPDDEAALARARERLAFDELLLLQLMMQRRRHDWQAAQGPRLKVEDEAVEALIDSQPFRFTKAQQRVLAEIRDDLSRETPMARLLQGEVGSGKTAVAAAALFIAVAAGGQGVLMAPTEILAEQHLRSLTAMYEHAGGALSVAGAPRPRVALLVGSMTRKEKQEVYDGLASGRLDVVVGTHAVIQDGVTPARLTLVIVDEQHRFGVRQRLTLTSKGENPHLLVMTATPIPRTMALSLYGDLDLSLLDEMPPGRQPIVTRLLSSDQRYLAYEFIRRQASEGRQSFIICPLVEGSEHLEARAATEEFERLRDGELKSLRLALLHGRMRPQEKEAVMRAFRSAEFDVLVSTSVVEVGVDVPNATVMLIEGAERFGLAQLHQFRGRVGRGQHPGTCILLMSQAGSAVSERLQAVVDAASGLELAEFDLKLRGPGDYFGERQSGIPSLRVASLADLALIERARSAARRLLALDPDLERGEHALLRQQVDAFVARAAAPS